MLITIYCIACYCFMYGMQEEIKGSGQTIRFIALLFSPLNAPRVFGQYVMLHQKVNRRIFGKMKARERKEKQREANRINEIMKSYFEVRGTKRAVDELNKKPANMATKGKSIYDVGNRRPMNY